MQFGVVFFCRVLILPASALPAPAPGSPSVLLAPPPTCMLAAATELYTPRTIGTLYVPA
jgi:hypothetical protein